MNYARPASFEPQAALNLSNLVTEIIERERCLTRHAGGRLSAAITPELYAQVSAIDLRRILTNLIENARRYGLNQAGIPELHVTLDGNSQSLKIKISDRGPGIPARDLERVRKPFSRGNSARTGASGTGLGLAIVDRLLQHMNGNLTFTPRTGGGLTVQVELFILQSHD
jgi:two-component system osmolarity sensor histidine kinase EnvZ